MRVVFVYPEVPDLGRLGSGRKEFPPFGVLYLAAIAEREGHDVRIIPAGEGATGYDLTDADFVGYSIASSATFALLRDVHRRSMYGEDTVVMIGGVHVNFFPEQSLRDFPAEHAGVGPCEASLPEMLEAAAVGRRHSSADDRQRRLDRRRRRLPHRHSCP